MRPLAALSEGELALVFLIAVGLARVARRRRARSLAARAARACVVEFRRRGEVGSW